MMSTVFVVSESRVISWEWNSKQGYIGLVVS